MFLPDTDPNAISLEGVMKALGSTESYEKNKHDLKALRDEHDRLALDLMKKAAAQLEFFDKMEPAKQKKLAEDTVHAVRLWPMELKKELLTALQQDFIAEQKNRKIK
jgi:predicted AAA+ superfamily ATPase